MDGGWIRVEDVYDWIDGWFKLWRTNSEMMDSTVLDRGVDELFSAKVWILEYV